MSNAVTALSSARCEFIASAHLRRGDGAAAGRTTWHRLIRIVDMPRLLSAEPWAPSLRGIEECHHGFWSVLCDWICCCGRVPTGEGV